MDSDTYEEQRVKQDDLWSRYLKEGQDVQLVLWKDMVISVDLPKVLELEVVQTDPNVKGNTAAGGSKPATLETGAVVQVLYCHVCMILACILQHVPCFTPQNVHAAIDRVSTMNGDICIHLYGVMYGIQHNHGCQTI